MKNTEEYTLHEWLEFWLKVYKQPSVRPSSYHCYQAMVKLIKNNFPDQPLNDIRPLQLLQLINDRLFNQLGLSKSTIKKVVIVLRQAFHMEMENGLCSGNPARKVTAPKNAAVKEVEALTPEEQERVEAACRSLPLGHLIIFLDLTGLRRGELINLKWEDYDAEEGTITVRKSKTDAGVRVIPLLPEAQEIIEQQPRWEQHIFLNTKGNPLSATSMNKLYMHLRKLTGIQTLTNHVCRHNFATRMLEHDADIKSVSKILGHTDVAFTLQRYTITYLDYLRRQKVEYQDNNIHMKKHPPARCWRVFLLVNDKNPVRVYKHLTGFL